MEITKEIIQIAAYLGAGLSVSITSITSGVGVGYIAGEAAFAMMRQPKAGDQIFRNMFIGQAITETGGIFALVISLLLLFGNLDVVEGGWFRFASMLGAGIAAGVGCIGPVFGSGYVGGQACKAIGRMPKHGNAIMGNMLIGQALAQTSAIFALVVALLLLYSTPLQPAGLTMGKVIIKSVSLFAAGLSIGFGTLGPGTGIGNVAGRASDMIGRFPNERSSIMRTMFLGSAVSQSTAIYALVISLLLLVV